MLHIVKCNLIFISYKCTASLSTIQYTACSHATYVYRVRWWCILHFMYVWYVVGSTYAMNACLLIYLELRWVRTIRTISFIQFNPLNTPCKTINSERVTHSVFVFNFPHFHFHFLAHCWILNYIIFMFITNWINYKMIWWVFFS